MSFLIMTVGKTHSGKTTFGKKIASSLKDYCLIDSDVISVFLKENFPGLYKNEFTKPSHVLKKKILLDIYKDAFATSLTIISTSSNGKKRWRVKLKTLARKTGRKIIMIYINLPEKKLLERINKDKRSPQCLYSSKNFNDLLNKQNLNFEPPKKNEADFFFEINDDKSSEMVAKQVLRLIK